jgi:hypothetical protein
MKKTTPASALALVLGLAALAAAPAALAQQPPPPGGEPGPHRAAPRVLVLTFGRGDQGRDEQAAKVQGLAEEVLLDYRFPLVDEQQLMASYQIDDLEKFVILSPERARLAELKARFGCELICVVQFTRAFQYEKEMFGTRQRFYKTDVRVKAIVPDTAEVVHSSGGETTIEARTTGLEGLVREHVKRLAERVLERWSHEAFGMLTIQVVGKNFDHAHFARLEQAVRGFPNVMELNERSFSGKADEPGSGLFEVKYNGGAEDLQRALAACPDPAVDIVSATPNRIEVVPVVRPGISFVAPEEGAVLGGPDVEAVVQVSGRDPQVEISGVAAQADRAGSFRARVPLRPGENVLVARMRDASGRTAEASRRVTLDAEPPTCAIVSPQAGLTNRKGFDVIVEARDDSGFCTVQVNGQPAQQQADGRFLARLENLPDGANEIVAVASDRAGHAAQARVTVTVDTVPPNLEGRVVAIIEGRVDKPGTVVTCDGKPVSLNPDGSFRFTIEAVSGSSVTLVAVDPAGNRAERIYRIGPNGATPR